VLQCGTHVDNLIDLKQYVKSPIGYKDTSVTEVDVLNACNGPFAVELVLQNSNNKTENCDSCELTDNIYNQYLQTIFTNNIYNQYLQTIFTDNIFRHY